MSIYGAAAAGSVLTIVLALLGQRWRVRRHQQEQRGYLVADAQGLAYHQQYRLVRRLPWRTIAQITFTRSEQADWWSDDTSVWHEEHWLLSTQGTAASLTILNNPQVQAAMLQAGSRYLPGWRATAATIPPRPALGSWVVYPGAS